MTNEFDMLSEYYEGEYICFGYSGYGIAAQALTGVIMAHDGRRPQTMLRNRILRSLGLSSSDELIGMYLLKLTTNAFTIFSYL